MKKANICVALTPAHLEQIGRLQENWIQVSRHGLIVAAVELGLAAIERDPSIAQGHFPPWVRVRGSQVVPSPVSTTRLPKVVPFVPARSVAPKTEDKSMHVRDPEPASVRVATCPEREVILDVGLLGNARESCGVELTPARAREVGQRLIEVAAAVEARSSNWIKPGVKIREKADGGRWEILNVSEQSVWIQPLPGGVEQSLTLKGLIEGFDPEP